MVTSHEWTFVSAFIDLDSYQKGNTNSRSAKDYLDSAISTLSLPVPLCIFLSESVYDIVLKKTENRTYPTSIIPINFEALRTFSFYERICKNRSSDKYKNFYTNNRNTPAYFILTASKFEFLKMAVEKNQFNSSMFAWIDFHYGHCDKSFSLESMHNQVKDIVSYPLSYWPKNRYNLGLISWVPTSNFLDKSLYDRPDGIRTGFAGGFNCGPASTINKIADALFKELQETVSQGMGHAEEQLYYYLYRKNPEWFDIFPCDYYSIIFNVLYPTRDINCTINFLLPKLVDDKQFNVAKTCIAKLIMSHTKGLIELPQTFFNKYFLF